MIRDGRREDYEHLVSWLKEPGVLSWYPMCNDLEVEDAAKYWISFAEKKALLVAEVEGVPCGLINLYVQESKKLAHHALMAIIVKSAMRGKGVGTLLIEQIKRRAKETFHMEMLLLEVYDGNPAIRLYERMGFKQYGSHRGFIKEEWGYVDKHLMQVDL